jgi:hypothetical protein
MVRGGVECRWGRGSPWDADLAEHVAEVPLPDDLVHAMVTKSPTGFDDGAVRSAALTPAT